MIARTRQFSPLSTNMLVEGALNLRTRRRSIPRSGLGRGPLGARCDDRSWPTAEVGFLTVNGRNRLAAVDAVNSPGC